MKYNYNYRDNEGNAAPTTLVLNGQQVLNPTAEMYAQCGYTPYEAPQPTEEELAEQARQARLAELHELLAESDYKAIKYAEGWISAADYAEVKAQRQAWRDEINELEDVDN